MRSKLWMLLLGLILVSCSNPLNVSQGNNGPLACQSLAINFDEAFARPAVNASLLEEHKDLIEAYKRTLHEYEERFVFGGYIANGIVKRSLIPIAEAGFTNAPADATLAVDSEYLGFHFALNDSRDILYMSSSKDFDQFFLHRVGQELTPLRRYFFISSSGTTLVLHYAAIYENIDYVESMLDMFQLTGDEHYLRRAETNILQINNRLEPNGQYRHLLPNGDNTYRGMPYARLIHAIQRYVTVSPSPNEEIVRSTILHAMAFEHTTEGVWDHWLYSGVGLLIANSILSGTKMNEGDCQNIRQAYDGFVADIFQFNKMQHVISRDHRQYPLFLTGYQAYGARGIGLLSTLVTLPDAERAFKIVHAEGVKTVSNNIDNMKSLEYAHRAYGYVDDALAERQRAFVQSVYDGADFSEDGLLVVLAVTSSYLIYRAERLAQ